MIKLKEKIHQANKIVVLSGAGLSAPSGIHTFRDNGGLWYEYEVEDVASTRAFRNNPELAWKFYDMRRAQLPNVLPNNAHIQLSILQKNKDVTLITQNVDDLLERAGCTDVMHLHGTLADTTCNGCDYSILNDNQLRSFSYACPECGDTLRPGVVLFGELLPHDEFQQSIDIISSLTKDDLLIVIGTSLEVYPVSGFPKLALNAGATIIEINKKPVLFGYNVYHVPMSCDEALMLLI